MIHPLLSPELSWIVPIFVFCIGACFGSFFNVCIYRIPLERSIASPGSHCAACGSPIAWYNNIPILSWLWLRGRAACCGTRIDLRYLIVEAITGILFVEVWQTFPDRGIALSYLVFVSGLIVASFIDIDHFIIPDRFTLGGCVAGLICCALVPQLQQQTTAWKGFEESLRGAFVCGLTLYIVAEVGTRLFKKEAMGMGDVKFMAAIGAFLGWKSIFFILPVSSFFGSIFGIFLIIGKQGSWGTRLPFGPFLVLAALVWIFGGAAWLDSYYNHAIHVLVNESTAK
jgi:leader peptidase (prepilin peptidase)/N-methyltransferase